MARGEYGDDPGDEHADDRLRVTKEELARLLATTPVKRPARAWRNKWRFVSGKYPPNVTPDPDVRILSAGVFLGFTVFPSAEAAEQDALETLAQDNLPGMRVEWMGSVACGEDGLPLEALT